MKKLLHFFLFLPFLVSAQVTKVDSSTITNYRKPKQSLYQSQTQYSYSVGINVFSYGEFPKILNDINESEYRKQFGTGFIVKLNDNQISYRITGNFYKQDISFKNDCEDCEIATGKLNDNSFRLGFERNFIYGFFQPYFGFDLGYRRNTFNGETESAGVPIYTSSDIKSQKNGLSMSPLFGFKFNIVNHFTLTAESSIDLLYSYEKQERVYHDANRTRTVTNYKKWEFLLRPVSMLTLQYNFGVNN